jgi:L-asparaginase / beta-aspartyl-peptidase
MATLLIHGGAGTIHERDRAAYHAGLSAARDAGFAALMDGADALSAALVAVSLMEDNTEAFNAGTGGSPNAAGIVECDAAVMAGWDGSAGAVGAVTRARNPILLAARVRRESPHVLLVGAGADAFVEDPVDNDELLTPRTRAALRAWQERPGEPANSATVGAVVCDRAGRLAAATSTGGMLGKWPGRIGDTPLIGAGTYADRSVAVSCTGKGEAFVRAVTAKGVAERQRHGGELRATISQALAEVLHFGGSGGLICVTHDGRIGLGFNSLNMAYAWRTDRQDANRPEAAEIGLEPGIYTL